MVEKLKADYDIEVDWRPFYLYWDTPPEGRELPEHVKERRAAGSEERLSQLAASYGMKFVSTKRIYNTRQGPRGDRVSRATTAGTMNSTRSYSGWSMRRVWTSASGMCCGRRQRKRGWMRKRCSAMWTRASTQQNVEQQVQQAYRMGVSGSADLRDRSPLCRCGGAAV